MNLFIDECCGEEFKTLQRKLMENRNPPYTINK